MALPERRKLDGNFFVKMIRGRKSRLRDKNVVKSNIPELPRAFLNFAFLC